MRLFCVFIKTLTFFCVRNNSLHILWNSWHENNSCNRNITFRERVVPCIKRCVSKNIMHRMHRSPGLTQPDIFGHFSIMPWSCKRKYWLIRDLDNFLICDSFKMPIGNLKVYTLTYNIRPSKLHNIQSNKTFYECKFSRNKTLLWGKNCATSILLNLFAHLFALPSYAGLNVMSISQTPQLSHYFRWTLWRFKKPYRVFETVTNFSGIEI